MGKLRYNRTFIKGLIAIIFCILLSGSVIGFFIAYKAQYNSLVSGMSSLEATIVDINYDVHVIGLDEQEIYIEYEVDGVIYSRELKTDTKISFAAGGGANYSVGDSVKIFYDPQNPAIIASPRAMSVGYFWLVFSLASLAFLIFVLFLILKNHKKYLVTFEEYEKEGQRRKEEKLKQKEQKKRAKLERKNRHPKLRKIGKIILISLGCLVGAFIIYLLFGLLLISVGY